MPTQVAHKQKINSSVFTITVIAPTRSYFPEWNGSECQQEQIKIMRNLMQKQVFHFFGTSAETT